MSNNQFNSKVVISAGNFDKTLRLFVALKEGLEKKPSSGLELTKNLQRMAITMLTSSSAFQKGVEEDAGNRQRL